MDVGWRRRAIRELHLPAGSRVFDLACGTGDFCRELRRAGYLAVGFDFSFGMLAAARTDVPLVQADALRLPVRDGSADGVTCGFALRNVVSLTDAVRRARAGGASGGRDRAPGREPAGQRRCFARATPCTSSASCR